MMGTPHPADTDPATLPDSILTLDKRSHAWVFWLNRPGKRNALSDDLVEALIKSVDEAHAAGIPLLVFRGEGANLSAGFDFSGYQSQSEGDLALRLIRIETLLQRVGRSPSLTVAFAHGKNFGAGVDLFAVCRLRYCAPGTLFRMPGLKFGLVLGSRRFRELVGIDAALSILGNTRSFDAEEAQQMNFVHQIAPQEAWVSLQEQAVQTAGSLGDTARRMLYAALDNSEEDTDMAALVRSVSEPGLKQRIQQYLNE